MGKLWPAGRRARGNACYPVPALCQALCETLRVENTFSASGSPGSRSRRSGGMVGSGFPADPATCHGSIAFPSSLLFLGLVKLLSEGEKGREREWETEREEAE